MITDFDFYVLDLIRENLTCDSLNFIMPGITTMGNAGIIWIFLSLCFLFSKRYRHIGILMLAGLALGAVLGNLILKPLIARPRPCWIREVPLLISSPRDYSFPSGHTLASFTCALILLKFHKGWGLAALFLAALMGFSRLYLYVHFPTDVIAGGIIGTATGISTCMIYQKLKSK